MLNKTIYNTSIIVSILFEKKLFYCKHLLNYFKKMKSENLRFYIQIRFKLGISLNNISKELKTALPGKSPSFSTVSRWYKKFKGGCEDLKDKHRKGRPITETTCINIDRVRNVIDNDPWCSYDEIEAGTFLSRGTIQTIIHEHLKMKKLTSRWVPHELSEKNRQDRIRICQQNLAMFKESKWRLGDVITGDECVFHHRQIGKKQSNKSWVYEGEKPRIIVKPGRFEPKTMFSIFFRTTGVVHISYLKRGETINHQSYLNDCLKPLVCSINEQRPVCGTKNLKFHHDNARPHVHSGVISYLKSQKFTIMDHPPYSPDLAPCDFWLFDYIKQRLGNHTSAQSLNEEITKIVSSIPEKEYKKTFDKWIERMEYCIKNKGDYFEHLIK